MTRTLPRRLVAMIAMGLLAAGCAATQNVRQVTELAHVGAEARILLMTPDIKLYTLTAGGVPELNPDATATARVNFADAARRYAERQGTRLVALDPAEAADPALGRYERLHGAVAAAIDVHHYNEAMKLPSKAGAFDWSLGPGIAPLGERYDASYALFVTYVDMSGSGGRWAFSIIAALVGVGMPTGGQSGYASLVDLRTGRIVWFNEAFGADVGAGDLRTPAGADTVVANLLDAMPRG